MEQIARHDLGGQRVHPPVQHIVVGPWRTRIGSEEEHDRLRGTVEQAGQVARVRIGDGRERNRRAFLLGHRRGAGRRRVGGVVDGEHIPGRVGGVVGIERDDRGVEIDQRWLDVGRPGAGGPQVLFQLTESEAGVLQHRHPLAAEGEAPSLGAQEGERAGQRERKHDQRDHHLDERHAGLRPTLRCLHGAATVVERASGTVSPGPVTVTVIRL